jgi:uncharacterized membrane protein YraQ (UPF0718 family)
MAQDTCRCTAGAGRNSRDPALTAKIALIVVFLAVWWPLYGALAPLSSWLTYGLLGIAPGTHLGEAVAFFLLDVPKIFLLLVLVVFGVGLVRSYFTPERTRNILAGKRETLGDVLAALLGIVTPFCSCSAVPLFIGFVESGIPIGVTFAFLISAPMVNESPWCCSGASSAGRSPCFILPRG